jgi:hypothetical protein
MQNKKNITNVIDIDKNFGKHTVDIFRLDKTIVSNINKIHELGDSGDDNLINSLIQYFSYSYKHNIFGYGMLDPAIFAKKFHYPLSYLRSVHRNPYQLENMTKDEIAEYREKQKTDPDFRIWDSLLENALYILANKPISLTKGVYKYKDKKGEKLLVAIQIIKSVRAQYLKNNKVIYQIVLNEDFLTNLTSYFVKGDRYSLISLRKPALDTLYLYLLNLKNDLKVKGQSKTIPEETPHFDLLCKFAGISKTKKDGTDIEAKYLKRDLIKALKEIQNKTNLNFDFTATKKTKYPYVFIFDFKTPIGEYVQRIELKDEMAAIFKENLGRQLFAMFRTVYNKAATYDNSTDGFQEWLFNATTHNEEKKLAYRQAQLHTYKKLHPDIRQMEEQFLKKIYSEKNTDIVFF